jgi:tetratricopeptide (TPR) repeat protein
MGFRVRKSIKIMPGVRMTFSPSGVSTSVGVRGARITRGSNGRITRTIGLPGSGISHTETIRSANGSRRRVTSQTVIPVPPVSPNLFSASYEKDFFKAKKLDSVQEYQRLVTLYPEAVVAGSFMLALKFIETKEYPLALQVLESIWRMNHRIDSDPLFRKYLGLKAFEVGIAEGVVAQLNLNRDAVGLLFAETLQSQGDLSTAIEVVEDLYPTQTTALSLADLYVAAGRWDEVIEVTNGITNVDDATCLLVIYRGMAFRETGYRDAAKEAFKESLKSKKRNMTIRHRGHAERALTYMADGKQALALKEVEKIMAENPNDEGVKLILSALDNGPKIDVGATKEVELDEDSTPETELPDADWYPDPLGADELRFWNGTEWTEYVSNSGEVTEKPL